MSAATLSAAELGLLSCHACGLVSRRPARRAQVQCPRCGSRLHARKPHSIARTWALVLAALIFYVPANLLPVMVTASIFGAQEDTIMSGVVYLWTSGSWPLAVIVFVASVMVPLAKLIALVYLLVSVQGRSSSRPDQRSRLYRMVELIGRWSMLDVFVVTVLAALVKLQALAVMTAGPGAVYFCAVVIVTMLAAMTFDPRLIWERQDGTDV